MQPQPNSTKEPPRPVPSKETKAAFVQRLSGTLTPRKPDSPPVLSFQGFPQYCSSQPLASIYELRSHISSVVTKQGATGTVYMAQLIATEGVVAVKVSKMSSLAVLHFSINEFEVLRQLNHPNIITVQRLILDADTSSSHLLMDYVPGVPLSQHLTEQHQFSGDFHAEKETRTVARQLFSALSLLETQAIVHRDVQPGNIVLTGNCVTLMDFQTACRTRDSRGVVGTAGYQAPEMWTDACYDCKADVWSAGTVLTRMLRNTHDLSTACLVFLAQCLMSDAAQRCSASEALVMPWLQ